MKNFGWIPGSMKTIGFFHAGQQNSIRSPWKCENHPDLFKKQNKKYCQILIRPAKQKYLE
jgi:hypothetical protein